MVQRVRYKLNMEDIQGKINAHFGSKPLNAREWSLLEEDRYIDDIQRHKGSMTSISEAVKYIRKIRWSQKEIPDEPQEGESAQVLSKEEAKARPGRSFALSFLLYEEASKEAEVSAFRTEVLADRLLSRSEVPLWIQQQLAADGEPTLWLELVDIPVSREDAMEILHTGIYTREGPTNFGVKTLARRFLKYGGPDNWILAVPTCIDGVLERLRHLSERLAQEYDWQEAQATLFVLTGAVPFISPIRVTNKMRGRPLYFSQRIVLDVDSTVSPEEVVKQYRLNRKTIKTKRTGNLSEKHLRLATFDAERPKGESWAKKLAEWNKTERLDWGYGNERRRFARDCLQARRRLLRQQKE